jgi:hypothetical protein
VESVHTITKSRGSPPKAMLNRSSIHGQVASNPSGFRPTVRFTVLVSFPRLILNGRRAPGLRIDSKTNSPSRTSLPPIVSSTSPATIPAFSAGDPGSTDSMDGYCPNRTTSGPSLSRDTL